MSVREQNMNQLLFINDSEWKQRLLINIISKEYKY